jgi:hypothetical protein
LSDNTPAVFTGQQATWEIGRVVEVSRGTVHRALEPDRLTTAASQLRALSTTMAERVGWSGSASVFHDTVAAIRPENVPGPADPLMHEPAICVSIPFLHAMAVLASWCRSVRGHTSRSAVS